MSPTRIYQCKRGDPASIDALERLFVATGFALERGIYSEPGYRGFVAVKKEVQVAAEWSDWPGRGGVTIEFLSAPEAAIEAEVLKLAALGVREEVVV